jgi:di/tricarboxylate transporter
VNALLVVRMVGVQAPVDTGLKVSFRGGMTMFAFVQKAGAVKFVSRSG